MSVYTITIPCFAQMLNTLKGLLAKGEARAEDSITLELPGGIAFEMTGNEYAVNWATPQFYFT